ncbi:kinase-like domain-containing protein [Dipodascopsis tothii]|uniref:kinase-like domain-containing protein n=1 Tax=Dipodascopsis tothii TaxID=44089 RepID=UPI0034CDD167
MAGPKYLPQFAIPLQDADAQIASTRRLLEEIFPSWGSAHIDVISVKGGITNCLLKGVHRANTPDEQAVLVRAYGRGTDTIIDRNREFCTHIHLHTHGLAPPLYGKFKNGLVYGFIAGRSVDYHELSDPALMVGVARGLAEWHSTLDATVIRRLMTETLAGQAPGKEPIDDIWQLCGWWISNLPTPTKEAVENKAALMRELVWAKNEIQAAGGPTVISHCDLLSGNILVPDDWPVGGGAAGADVPKVAFIDYEYALPTPRAFDLANHFMEWQGFDCDTSLIPAVGGDVMRSWGRHYLEGLPGDADVDERPPVTDAAVDGLMAEIAAWWGMPGFYWGIWATIQAVISTIDFDYKSYADIRLKEYWQWKERYLAAKAGAPGAPGAPASAP